MRLNYRILALALLLTPVASAAQQAPPKLDAYVRRVMETFTVPGLSVAIVKDGKVVLAKGYGVRRMGDPAPDQLKMVPASDAVDFSFDFQDLLLKPVGKTASRPLTEGLPPPRARLNRGDRWCRADRLRCRPSSRPVPRE